MSEHSVFAFSASPRWVPCAGSMAYPENTAEDTDAGVYADEGSAAHLLGSWVLKEPDSHTSKYLGKKIAIGKRTFEVTEEFANPVQDYVDDVIRRTIGGYRMIEQRVTLDGVEGFDETNYGTSDVIGAMPARAKAPPYGLVIDLKYGKGEKVYAWNRATKESLFTFTIYSEADPIEIEPNFQLMFYALAALQDVRMLVGEPDHMMLVINQPRLGNISELRVPIAVLERFAIFAAEAYAKSLLAMGLGVKAVEAKADEYLKPGDKQCRWCRAMARCPALRKKLQDDMGAEFDTISEAKPLPVPVNAVQVAKDMLVLPLLAEWCRAVMAQANKLVSDGIDIIGPDKKPYKFVEGKQGDRKWTSQEKAEAALAGVLGDKAYVRKILTPPAAAKILNKKKTAQTWTDVFAPLITRAPGKPILVLGSDERPPYSPVAAADEFEDVEDSE